MKQLWRLVRCWSCLCLLCMIPVLLQAQEEGLSESSCENLLTMAQQAFQAGILHEIDTEGLKRCMQEQSPDYLTRASKLLILTHLYLDQDSIARRFMVALLKTNPEFKPDPTDPQELQVLYGQYITEPIFMVGAMISGNRATPVIHNRYSIGNALSSAPDYDYAYGYQYSVLVARELRLLGVAGLYIKTGASYAVRSFGYSEKLQTDPSLDLDFSTTFFKEVQNWWDLPVHFHYHLPSIRWSLSRRELIPYLDLGGAGHFLMLNKLTGLRRVADDQSLGEAAQIELTVGQENVSVLSQRRRWDISYSGGFGLLYKVNSGYVVFDVKYRQGMRSLANPERRYDSNRVSMLFGHVDDDFSMRDVSFSIGLIRNFYEPTLVRHLRDQYR